MRLTATEQFRENAAWAVAGLNGLAASAAVTTVTVKGAMALLVGVPVAVSGPLVFALGFACGLAAGVVATTGAKTILTP